MAKATSHAPQGSIGPPDEKEDEPIGPLRSAAATTRETTTQPPGCLAQAKHAC
jgi:hypothetical protein